MRARPRQAPAIVGRPASRTGQSGFSLVEALIATVIGASLLVTINIIIGQGLQSRTFAQDSDQLIRDARFAMDQMLRAVARSQRLVLPLHDSAGTAWPDNLREESVPPSAPPTGSTLMTAVLAVTIDPQRDLDGNDVPDADNDGDGRIDEDLPDDITNDAAPGVYLIDDMGDGTVDKFIACCSRDDEEDFGIADEDPVNGIDDDGDGLVDEDPGSDTNGDGCPGDCGIDDDADGQIDEGVSADDDEDGQLDEDWYDVVVFYLANGVLMQRTPVPWDESGNAVIDGRDYIEQPIAENISYFRVERLPPASGRPELLDLTLESTSPVSNETVSLNTRIRVGGAL